MQPLSFIDQYVTVAHQLFEFLGLSLGSAKPCLHSFNGRQMPRELSCGTVRQSGLVEQQLLEARRGRYRPDSAGVGNGIRGSEHG